MKKILATIAWVPCVAILALMAGLSALLVAMTALMVPAVRWLAKMGDE